MSDISTAEIMDMGIKYLIEKMGIIDAERFISVIIRERSDYTKWRQRYFADVMDPETFHNAAAEYGRKHPL